MKKELFEHNIHEQAKIEGMLCSLIGSYLYEDSSIARRHGMTLHKRITEYHKVACPGTDMDEYSAKLRLKILLEECLYEIRKVLYGNSCQQD